MGGCMSNFCRSGIYITIPLDHVEASTETVFDVFLDVERLPTISTQIESTELIVTGNRNNDSSRVVGRKWKERRNYEGRILKDIFTVTSMTRTLDKATGEDAITVTYSIDFVKNNFKTRQATQTGSLTAHPTSTAGSQKPTCRLTMTVSFVAEGCISGTLVRCCRAGIEQYGEMHGLQALSELAAAARRRQKEINLEVDEEKGD